MPPQFIRAVDLLRSLGVSEPSEIDICAIAQTQGATVVEKLVKGAEARIVGVGDKALIVVNADSTSQRKRFSVGHELGHWMRDSGVISLGCSPELQLGSGDANTETRANGYASDLLMPDFMFRPRAQQRPMTFDTASDLADAFNTSLTATSIRLIDYGSYPAILVCSDIKGVRWYRRGPEVPKTLQPQHAGRMTFASDLLRGTGGRSTSGQVQSGQWFASAKRHCVHEDSRRISSELVLTLLWWEDEGPLIEIQEEQERRDYRRSDRRDE